MHKRMHITNFYRVKASTTSILQKLHTGPLRIATIHIDDSDDDFLFITSFT